MFYAFAAELSVNFRKVFHGSHSLPISLTESSSASWKAVLSMSPRSRLRHTWPSLRIIALSQKEAAKAVMGHHEYRGAHGPARLEEAVYHRPAGL